jgi:large subunit ribosomal protein L15
MQIHNLKPANANIKARRIGRGGKRGKTSGRGTKGQRARAGHRMRPELRDIIKKIPKLRGHGKNRARGVNASRVRPVIINLAQLGLFSPGEHVTSRTLITKRLIKKTAGKIPAIKVLGTGAINKPLLFNGLLMSDKARKKIEQAGGKVM